MRLVGMLLVCLLMEAFAFGEKNDGTHAPRTLQGKLALYVSSWAQGNLVNFDADTGEKLGALSGVEAPVDVDLGPNDDIFVVDEASGAANVRRFDPNTGTADQDPYGDTGSYLGAPRGLAFGPDGHLYVADVLFVISEVLEFDENGDYVGVLPDDEETPVLLTVEDIACDGSGNLYVTQWVYFGDEIPGIYKFTGSGWAMFGQTGNLESPWGMAFGPDGDLYVVDDDPDHFGVYRYDGTAGTSKGVFGQTASDTNLGEPRYLTFGPNGDLFVTDVLDSSVRVFSGPLKPDAGAFKGVFGQTAGNVPEPLGLVFGPAGIEPELSIEKLDTGNTLLTLTGPQGKSYELRYNSDPTVSDFTEWTFGATIDLQGATTGSWEDDTASSALRRFYKAKEQ